MVIQIDSKELSARPSAALVVVAHPDDESMFFGPVIQSLCSRGVRVCLLCFSTGDAHGLGQQRVAELHRACSILKIRSSDVCILNDPELKDGQREKWSAATVCKAIETYLAQQRVQLAVSFDPGGISGHANHCALAQGFRAAAATVSRRQCSLPAFYQLVTVGLLRKFAGPLEALLAACLSWHEPDQLRVCLATSPMRLIHAMQQHRSQWVWYRKIFIVMSRYTYINNLQRLE